MLVDQNVHIHTHTHAGAVSQGEAFSVVCHSYFDTFGRNTILVLFFFLLFSFSSSLLLFIRLFVEFSSKIQSIVKHKTSTTTHTYKRRGAQGLAAERSVAY